METETLETLTVRYGRRLEALLETLGATGEAKGAGEMLDQVKHLLDEEGLRRIRRFLRLRNEVVHNRPADMPMPTKEALEKAALEAIGVLERAVEAQRRKAQEQREQSSTETNSGAAIRLLLGLGSLAAFFFLEGFLSYLFLFLAVVFILNAFDRAVSK